MFDFIHKIIRRLRRRKPSLGFTFTREQLESLAELWVLYEPVNGESKVAGYLGWLMAGKPTKEEG